MAWEAKKLGEVCEIGAGNSAPQDKKMFKDGKYPFFRTSDIGKIHIGFIDKSVDNLNELGIKKLKHYTKGTLLFPKSGASTFLNHRVVMNVGGYVSSHLATLKANNSILGDKYLFYFSLNIDSRNLMQDQNYPSLRLSDIQAIDILVPPLPIQKQIVAILDKAFEKISKAKENSEQNLKNAKEIFEVTLQKIFNNSSFKKSKLSNIAEFQYGYTAKSNSKGKYRYVRITDISSKGLLNIQNKVYIPNFDDYKNYLLSENDLLMARTGASFGDVLLYENFEPSIFASYLIRIKFKIKLNPKIYWFFSKSKIYWIQARKLSSGSAQPHFNGKALGKVIFSYPESTIEQDDLILKMEHLNSDVKKLESIYNKKLTSLEELKQSILQKAFAGELTEVSA